MPSITYDPLRIAAIVSSKAVAKKISNEIKLPTVYASELLKTFEISEETLVQEKRLYSGDYREKFFPKYVEIAQTRVKSNYPELPISVMTLYCQKTGQPIGQLSQEMLIQAYSALGETRLAEILYYANHTGIALAWAYTAPQDLDLLIGNDPVAYATYCLNLITGHYLDHINWRNKEKLAAHHWAVVRAFHILLRLPERELETLNDNLCGILTYAPETIRWLARELSRQNKSPDAMAAMAAKGELISYLDKAINAALGSLERTDAELYREKYKEKISSPEDLARGPSQIRGQKRAKKKIETDTYILKIGRELCDELGELMNPKAKEAPRKINSYLEKLRMGEKEKPTISDDMIKSLGDFDFGDDDAEIESDDDTVEMRTISREHLEIRNILEEDLELPELPELTPIIVRGETLPATKPPQISIREKMQSWRQKAPAITVPFIPAIAPITAPIPPQSAIAGKLSSIFSKIKKGK